MSRDSHSAGKGWRPRPVGKNFGKNMDKIFGPKEIKTWSPDEKEKIKKPSKNSKRTKN